MNKKEYIMKITEVVASKSTCDRAFVGAVFVNDDFEILATGYNGSPKGFAHCDEIGHMLVNNHCIATIHAEQNGIVQAAKRGTSLKNSTLYCTHSPCHVCALLLINLGVKEVCYRNVYAAEQLTVLRSAGIRVFSW